MEPLLLTYIVAITLLSISPGVDTVLVLRNTARGGVKDGMLTNLGIGSGLFIHATVSALGISAILLQSAWAFTTLKLAGAAYLIWLGISSLRGAVKGTASLQIAAVTGRCKPLRSLREGLLSNVLNPKPIVFYMAFLPQFIDPAGNVMLQSLFLAAIHFAISCSWQGGLVLLVNRARQVLAMPAVGSWLDGITGGAMVLLGGKLALDSQ
ncbi:LysE family translocator [Marinobacterium jannaschii]|uniref:LysE family translocator n=1 Tax=Marinobacterium jannaschii TaxID=64970 RepID=UPI000484D5DA|nr:LysE family translocator [Marinobacterium jannaschii]